MATRNERLAQFNDGEPPPGTSLQVLAEDHNGTYLLPFPCEWRDGGWHNVERPNDGQPLEANIIGWRAWRA